MCKFVDNNRKLLTIFLPVQRILDGYSCGHFSVTYAAKRFDGNSPTESSLFILSQLKPLTKENFLGNSTSCRTS